MLGFNSFQTATCIREGVEAMHMIKNRLIYGISLFLCKIKKNLYNNYLD